MTTPRYDVTAVSDKDDYIPLAANVAGRDQAERIAQAASHPNAAAPGGFRDPDNPRTWSAVLVKHTETGITIRRYVRGQPRPEVR